LLHVDSMPEMCGVSRNKIECRLVFSHGQCIELMGTPFVHEFDWCPILAAAMGRNVKQLPVHGEKTSTVIFRPIFEDGAWEIEALCPNFVVERIKWFKSEIDATGWIEGGESRAWLLAKGYLYRS
jgi:hypothetical protein